MSFFLNYECFFIVVCSKSYLMVCTVHIVPVGHTKETLIGSLRRFPVDRVVLVLGKDGGSDGEKIARKVAAELKKDLGSIPWEELELDLDDVSAVALAVSERITEERSSGCIVMVNLSGSLRSAGVGCYLAALVTRTPAYIGLPSYKGGKPSGVREVKEVPLIPLKDFSKEKKDILKALVAGPKLMGDLLSANTEAERSRLSYHLKDLKKDGLVEANKEGRNLRVSLSFAGRLYAQGLA